MKIEKTNRGFAYIEFEDRSGRSCSLQKSSLATADAVWLGCTEIGLKRFAAGLGWQDIELVDTMRDHYVANNRMELTREQVAELLPHLQRFVETGECHSPIHLGLRERIGRSEIGSRTADRS